MPVSTMNSDFPALLQRLEQVTGRLEQLVVTGSKSAATPAPAGTSSGLAPSLDAFDQLLNGPVVQWLQLSEKVGGLVQEQALLVKKALYSERQFLEVAAHSKKPAAAPQLQQLLKPTSEYIQQIVSLREKNRPSPLFNHLSTVSEGIPALGWIAVEPKPAPYIGEMKDAAQFYANRILKEFKDKDKVHVEWSQAFTAILMEMQNFVKKYHTTGVVWNPNGGEAKLPEEKETADAGGAPPPPPGPPPPPMQFDDESKSTGADGKPDMSGLFSQINQGSTVTSGLKKVDKSQMTHKNPELRLTSVVKASDRPSSAAASSTAPSSRYGSLKKSPKTSLDGNKWTIEYHENNRELVIDQTELKQIVYIYACNNCTIQIKGKVNAVTVDNCTKTAIVVENVLASLDIVNCKSLQAQILGRAPTAIVDKTDGLQLFLSRECLDIEVFSAKSSEMNISIPGKTDQDDFVECAIPEQFKTVIKGAKIETCVVEHKG